MNRVNVDEVWEEIEKIILSPTKKAAEPSVMALRTLARGFELRSNSYEKLMSAIGYAHAAAGCAQDKEHWISCAKAEWTVFKKTIRI